MTPWLGKPMTMENQLHLVLVFAWSNLSCPRSDAALSARPNPSCTPWRTSPRTDVALLAANERQSVEATARTGIRTTPKVSRAHQRQPHYLTNSFEGASAVPPTRCPSSIAASITLVSPRQIQDGHQCRSRHKQLCRPRCIAHGVY